MNWVNNKKKIVVSIVLVSALSMGILGNVIYSKANESSSRLSAITRLQNLRNSTLSKTININREKNKTVRAIVVLDEDAVAASVKGDISEYNSKLKSKEEDIIEEQESIIKKVEKITDNEVVNQSAFLVNSFSIDATREDMENISKLKGVRVYVEASTFKIQMTDAVAIGKVNSVWQSSEYGYTGEGTVVAVIDTGVNYNHQDMVLAPGTKTKYTKEEWQEKIKLIGHGKYCSDKVPFGYDYVTGVDECLNTRSFHGYHVSGIVGANGEIAGVAKNAQILGIKVLGNEGVGTTDDLVKGIEDSVKLGADIINMSLGYECSVKSDEDYLQEAINKANEEGVLCCIAACNDGTSASGGDNKNIVGTIDTATIGSPSVAKGSLSVASVDNISGDELVNMSSFSSWGPTNELNIKPEISAPGGNITSTYNGTSAYLEQSGTSMATPYIAGCEALVLNSIKAKGYALENNELTLYMKATLMNTANVITDKSNGNPYSVRYQGAGLVDVESAIKNKVIALCNNEPKIELGEIDGSRTVEITLTNYGDTDASYNVDSASLYTNFIEKETGNYFIVPISDSNVTFSNKEINVPAKSSVSIMANINIGNLESEAFVEGFISFKGNDVEDLGMPILGFYGDWSKETIIDSSVYDDEKSIFDNEYNMTKNSKATGLVGVNDGKIDTYLGLNGGRCNGEISSFSPNGDNVRDCVAPLVAAIRSPKEVKVRVLDSEKNVLREVATCTDLKKIHSYLANDYIKASVLKSAINGDVIGWDGMLYNSVSGKYEVVRDGSYYIELVSKINDNGKEQSIVMPVKIDTDKPKLTECELVNNNEETDIIFKLEDNVSVSPYVYVDICTDEKTATKAYEYEKDIFMDDEGKYKLNLGNVTKGKVTVMWEDEAGNQVLVSLDEEGKLENIDNKGNVITDEVANDSSHINMEDNTDINKEDNSDTNQNKDTEKPYIKLMQNDGIEKLANCPIIEKFMILMKEEGSTEVSFDVQILDDNLQEDSFKIVAGTLTVQDGKYSTFINNYSKSVIKHTYKGNGMYNVNVALDDVEEELFITIADKAGNISMKGIYIFTTDAKDNYERRISVNSMMYKINLDNPLITKEMLNEDGTFTVKGMLNGKPKALVLNGKNVVVNEETMEFEENILLNNGCNKVNFSIQSGTSEKAFFTNLYYDDIRINLHNEIGEKDVIHVDSEEFVIREVIKSYISIGKIDINGENVYTGVNGVVAEDGEEIVKEFKHKVKLSKGENKIKIKVTNSVGHICEKSINVIYRKIIKR